MELRTFADWTVRPRLLSVPGVARCIVFGGQVRQLQIQVRPDRLQAYGLSISDVLAAARVSTGVMGAGFVENANQRILIQTEGQALTPEVLGEVVVHTIERAERAAERRGAGAGGAGTEIRRCAHPGRPGDFAFHGQPVSARTRWT